MTNKVKNYKDLPKKYRKIFKKMFSVVGANIKTFNLNKDDWYYSYHWTEERETKFKKWLRKYVKKLYPILNDIGIESEVGMFLLNYSWTYSKEKCMEYREKTNFKPDYTLLYKIKRFFIKKIKGE